MTPDKLNQWNGQEAKERKEKKEKGHVQPTWLVQSVTATGKSPTRTLSARSPTKMAHADFGPADPSAHKELSPSLGGSGRPHHRSPKHFPWFRHEVGRRSIKRPINNYTQDPRPNSQ